jgi:UDP-N-acetylglucosamine 1-carboxyvinyltransferase
MESFIIEGGQPLKGSITPQGAKNEALQILCAVLLTPEVVDIHNIPDIVDVNKLIKLLENFGVLVKKISKGHFSLLDLEKEASLGLEEIKLDDVD